MTAMGLTRNIVRRVFWLTPSGLISETASGAYSKAELQRKLPDERSSLASGAVAATDARKEMAVKPLCFPVALFYL
jgi:hypothetical protein